VEASQERLLEEQAMRLYMAYPRHVARGAALRAIRKALLTEEFAFLMAAVTEYRGARESHVALDADQKNYTPYPATWFNQERYHDDRGEWYPPGPEIPTELAWEMVRRTIRLGSTGEVLSELPDAIRSAADDVGWTSLRGMDDFNRDKMFRVFKGVYERG
jgi:hypothetical protein